MVAISELGCTQKYTHTCIASSYEHNRRASISRPRTFYTDITTLVNFGAVEADEKNLITRILYFIV